MEKNVSTNALSQKLIRLGMFLNKHMGVILCVLMVGMMFSGIALAEGGVDADALWGNMMDMIKKWVTRLGGVVMIIGGVMFGLGWQREDASAKSNGVTTMMAGAIVIAVVQAIGTFVK